MKEGGAQRKEVLKDFWALEFSGDLYSDVRIKKKEKKGASLTSYIAGRREKRSILPKKSRNNDGRSIRVSPLDEGDKKPSEVNGRAS